MAARINLNTRVMPATAEEVNSWGDPIARHYGEGARPKNSEIMRTVLAVFRRHPELIREAQAIMMQHRRRDV